MAESKFSSDLISTETYSVTKELNWNKIWPLAMEGKLQKDHPLSQAIFKNK